MSVFVQCEHCGKSYKLNESMQGQRVRCQNCSHVFHVPLQVDRPARHSTLIAPTPSATPPQMPATAPDGPPPVQLKLGASQSAAPTQDDDPDAPAPSLYEQNRASPRARSVSGGAKSSQQTTLLIGATGIMILATFAGGLAFIWSKPEVSTALRVGDAAAPISNPRRETTAPKSRAASPSTDQPLLPARSAPPADPEAVTPSDVPEANAASTVGAETENEIAKPAAPAAPSPSDALRYVWRPGQDLSYEMVANAEAGGERLTLSATATYHVDQVESASQPENPQAPQIGTGTGFFVSNDGYLVTCAHVVKGATELEVVLGEQSWPGEVVALDEPNDLAVVRVSAKDLPILAMGDAGKVELAQEVRAVGFPLSDVLGTSIKITRGTISGILRLDDNRRRFQVDCSINPGNSGGPVVDETGAVVGVASAKLAGELISNVGFAVPVDEVIKLLDSQDVKYRPAGKAKALPGPELARQVTPSVPLLVATIGPENADGSQGVGLSCSGSYAIGGTKVSSEGGKLRVDQYGEVLNEANGVPLPLLLGTLGQMMLNPLSADGQRAWGTEREVSLTQTDTDRKNTNSPIDDILNRGRRDRFGSPSSRRESKRVTHTPAVERMGYELGPVVGNIAQIKKYYELRLLTEQKTAGDAVVTGEGTISFDMSLGLPQEIKYTATITPAAQAPAERIAVELTITRVDAPISQREAGPSPGKKPPPAAAASAPSTSPPPSSPPVGPPDPPQNVPQPASGAKTITDAELAKCVKSLSSKDVAERTAAMGVISQLDPVTERRAEVAVAVCDRLLDTDSGIRFRACFTIEKWVGPECLSGLIAALDSKVESLVWPVCRCLGQIPDRRASAALAKLVAEGDNMARSLAFGALEKMGSMAEPDAIALLDHANKDVRVLGCRFLRAHGGPAGRAALMERIDGEQDRMAKFMMQNAIKAIK